MHDKNFFSVFEIFSYQYSIILQKDNFNANINSPYYNKCKYFSTSLAVKLDESQTLLRNIFRLHRLCKKR